ncbi:MAG: hypothetical protein HXX20_24440 [Chloroflexi bacterium]|nr:hypothetical protein [Chloroflexota bacterium]
MSNLLLWYDTLSRSRNFRWAKVWMAILVVLMATLGYFGLNGQGLEWMLILGLPIIFAVSNLFEALGRAYRYTALAQMLVASQVPSITEEPKQSEPDQPEPEPQLELTDADRLSLCQYYVFLYLLFQLRKTGEETFYRMVSLPKGRYREWLEGLKAEGLELVQTVKGKTTLTEVEFGEALHRIATHDDLSQEVWDFPCQVYADKRNWKEYDPSKLEIAPGRIVHIKMRPDKVREETALLPIYPTRLKDLKIEPNL